jgi:hypothetical protein
MDIESEIKALQERNKRVEVDKAWEVSWTRRLTICVLTYIIAVVWLVVINESNIFLKAAVPVFGYILSTLSLPIIKKKWIVKNK